MINETLTKMSENPLAAENNKRCVISKQNKWGNYETLAKAKPCIAILSVPGIITP